MLSSHRLSQLERHVNFFASRAPADYYAYGRWRVAHWIQKNAPKGYDVDRSALVKALDVAKLTRFSREDRDLSQWIASHFKKRRTPTFFFDGRHRQRQLAGISDADTAATLRAADAICRREFTFRGVQVNFAGSMDWRCTPEGNVDWRWDLNRHTYFVTLGRAYWYSGENRYALEFRALLRDWLERNPARTNELNWQSVFEVACRINPWIWSFYLFRDAPAMDTDTILLFLCGLLAHGRYLDANIELHVPNNHLLLEAKALTVLGILFPEFPETEKWRRRGLKILTTQVEAQVGWDGVHGERAMLYHQIVASELLEWLVLMENNHLCVTPYVRSTVQRMIDFESAMRKPDGTLPLLGDSALEDTHLRVPPVQAGLAFFNNERVAHQELTEATHWLLGPKRVSALRDAQAVIASGSRAFFEGGYFVMRGGQDADALYLVFDCGPFGLKRMPNHGHADALSLELYAYGQTMLLDPGFYSTSLGEEWRNYFRGTRAHNTVTVDERDQSELLDVRRVYRPAQARLLRWESAAEFDFADGQHDGYTRLRDRVLHRRQVFFFKPFYWVVLDWLNGEGVHTFDLYYHFPPGAAPELDPISKSLRCLYTNQARLDILPLANGDLNAEILIGQTDPIQGWASFCSGEKQPAPVLRYRRRASAPTLFCTVLCPSRSEQALPLAVHSISVESLADSKSNSQIALQIENEAYVDHFFLDCGAEAQPNSVAHYATDASFLLIRHTKPDLHPIQVIRRGRRSLGETVSAVPLPN